MIGEDRLIHFSGVAKAEACTIVLRGASASLWFQRNISTANADQAEQGCVLGFASICPCFLPTFRRCSGMLTHLRRHSKVQGKGHRAVAPLHQLSSPACRLARPRRGGAVAARRAVRAQRRHRRLAGAVRRRLAGDADGQGGLGPGSAKLHFGRQRDVHQTATCRIM